MRKKIKIDLVGYGTIEVDELEYEKAKLLTNCLVRRALNE